MSIILFILLSAALGYWVYRETTFRKTQLEQQQKIEHLEGTINGLSVETASLSAQIKALEEEDLRKTNRELRARITEVQRVFLLASKVIEDLSDARYQGVNVMALERDLAQAVSLLAQQKYEDAQKLLAAIDQRIQSMVATKQAQITAPEIKELPAAGSYRRQSVKTDRGNFVVSMVAEKISSVRIITDTANDDTCKDSCPILPLATYVQRNGGFAGINGTYFCPQDYPSCAGKVNSFSTLVFNSRLKKYMNSDENVYSVNPMVVQHGDRSIRFMGQALEWGRDTGINAGLSNFPMLVSGGTARVTDTGAKGPRGFIGTKGDAVYIGVVHSASLGDAAITLAALGLETAMNLDGGGSSALMYNGRYQVGPGRNLPNAIIFAR